MQGENAGVVGGRQRHFSVGGDPEGAPRRLKPERARVGDGVGGKGRGGHADRPEVVGGTERKPTGLV